MSVTLPNSTYLADLGISDTTFDAIFAPSGIITGNFNVGGTLAVTGNETVGGNLTVTGNETVGGNLTVTGTINGGGGGVSITSIVLAKGSAASPSLGFSTDFGNSAGLYQPAVNELAVTANATQVALFQATLVRFLKALQADLGITITGDAVISGDVIINQPFNGTPTDVLQMTGNANITGNETLSGTLGVTGLSTLSGSVSTTYLQCTAIAPNPTSGGALVSWNTSTGETQYYCNRSGTGSSAGGWRWSSFVGAGTSDGTAPMVLARTGQLTITGNFVTPGILSVTNAGTSTFTGNVSATYFRATGTFAPSVGASYFNYNTSNGITQFFNHRGTFTGGFEWRVYSGSAVLDSTPMSLLPNGNLTVTGTISAQGVTFTDLIVNGTTQLNGSLTVGKLVPFQPQVTTLNGATTVNGTFTVVTGLTTVAELSAGITTTGALTAASAVITAALGVGGSLTVTGASALAAVGCGALTAGITATLALGCTTFACTFGGSFGTSLSVGSLATLTGGFSAGANSTISGANTLEFGQGVTKGPQAGYVGYQTYSTCLDIVGAGATNGTRAVRVWDILCINQNFSGTATDRLQITGNASISGNISTPSGSVSALQGTFGYLKTTFNDGVGTYPGPYAATFLNSGLAVGTTFPYPTHGVLIGKNIAAGNAYTIGFCNYDTGNVAGNNGLTFQSNSAVGPVFTMAGSTLANADFSCKNQSGAIGGNLRFGTIAVGTGTGAVTLDASTASTLRVSDATSMFGTWSSAGGLVLNRLYPPTATVTLTICPGGIGSYTGKICTYQVGGTSQGSGVPGVHSFLGSIISDTNISAFNGTIGGAGGLIGNAFANFASFNNDANNFWIDTSSTYNTPGGVKQPIKLMVGGNPRLTLSNIGTTLGYDIGNGTYDGSIYSPIGTGYCFGLPTAQTASISVSSSAFNYIAQNNIPHKFFSNGGVSFEVYQNYCIFSNFINSSLNPFGYGAGTVGQTGRPWQSMAATAYNTVSDRRLKTDIADMDGTKRGLTFIESLRPRTFQYTRVPNPTTKLGFIAQEIEEVAPDFEGMATDSDGLFSIEMTSFIAPLVAAVQQLSARVQTLEAALASSQSAKRPFSEI